MGTARQRGLSFTHLERVPIMAERKPRGFAAMDAEKQRLIASKGGKAAHAKGTAHQFTPEEARAAGRKGGQAAHAKGTAHEFTPEEARAAGRKGGQSSHAGRTKGSESQGGEQSFEGQHPQGMSMPSTGTPQGSTGNFESQPAATTTNQGQAGGQCGYPNQGTEHRNFENI